LQATFRSGQVLKAVVTRVYLSIRLTYGYSVDTSYNILRSGRDRILGFKRPYYGQIVGDRKDKLGVEVRKSGRPKMLFRVTPDQAHGSVGGDVASPVRCGPRQHPVTLSNHYQRFTEQVEFDVQVAPINAMRNYLFACLESEARLALLAHGCDPTMGVLHADQRNRDSLALDTIEEVRGDADSFLLDLLEDREFTARDFGELPNGICRIAAPLTHELALTLPHWRECLRPIAARLAQTFRESLANGCAAPRILAAKSANKRRSIPGPERSPLLATPRKASEPRPYATRAWRTPTVEPRPANPTACAMCGEAVLKRRRRHCDTCMPKARREHGLRAIEAARKVLAAQTAEGHDPRRSAVVNRVRGEAIAEGHRRNRRWAHEHPGQRDEAWFKREIAPKLDASSLKEIAVATGLSLAACSRIRGGAQVPHPRHWEALLTLVDR